jgi:tRNA isopentenyl-2-thiomethyl-A-37 hydroxylase MiaE
MEQLRTTEVNNRVIHLNTINLQLLATQETLRLIRKTDNCTIINHLLQEVHNLNILIKQELHHIEITGNLPEEESYDELQQNQEPNLDRVLLNLPHESEEYSE